MASTPPMLIDAGLEREYREAMGHVKADIEQLRKSSQEAALYAIPLVSPCAVCSRWTSLRRNTSPNYDPG